MKIISEHVTPHEGEGRMRSWAVGEYANFFRVYYGNNPVRERLLKDFYTPFRRGWNRTQFMRIIMEIFKEFMDSGEENLLLVGNESVDIIKEYIEAMLFAGNEEKELDILIADKNSGIVDSYYYNRDGIQYGLVCYHVNIRLDTVKGQHYTAKTFIFASRKKGNNFLGLRLLDKSKEDYDNYIGGRITGLI